MVGFLVLDILSSLYWITISLTFDQLSIFNSNSININSSIFINFYGLAVFFFFIKIKNLFLIYFIFNLIWQLSF